MNWNSASQSYKGTKVSLKAAQPGDLIFWSSNGSNTGVYHVAIYIGNGQYIVAPHTGTDVQIQTISSYFQPSFAKRVL
jgi:cell wall-associated NlpC family hydrolase